MKQEERNYMFYVVYQMFDYSYDKLAIYIKPLVDIEKLPVAAGNNSGSIIGK